MDDGSVWDSGDEELDMEWKTRHDHFHTVS